MRARIVTEPSRVWLAAGPHDAVATADRPDGAVVVPLADPEGTTLAVLQRGDEIELTEAGLRRTSGRSGGTEGGMSTGEVLRVRAAMKPIATVPRALARRWRSPE